MRCGAARVTFAVGEQWKSCLV